MENSEQPETQPIGEQIKSEQLEEQSEGSLAKALFSSQGLERVPEIGLMIDADLSQQDQKKVDAVLPLMMQIIQQMIEKTQTQPMLESSNLKTDNFKHKLIVDLNDESPNILQAKELDAEQKVNTIPVFDVVAEGHSVQREKEVLDKNSLQCTILRSRSHHFRYRA